MTAADDSRRVLDDLDRAALEPFRGAWSDVDGIWDAVWEPLQTLAEAHRALLVSHGLDADTSGADRGEALVAYRHAAAHGVQRRFLEALRGIDPMRRIGEARDRAEEHARARAGALEARLVLPWDDAGLARRDTDGFSRRVATALVRGMRRVRSSAPRPGVPVRALAYRIVRREAIPGQRRAFDETQRSWAAWMAVLERAWDAWADQLLSPLAPVPPGRSGRGEEDAGGARAERWNAAVAAVRALQQALDRAAASGPHEEARAQGMEALARARSVLARELPLAGTVALPLSSDLAPAPGLRGRSRLTWEDWYDHAVNRFVLHASLLDVVLGSESAVARFEERVDGHIGGDLSSRCVREAEGLRHLARGLGRAEGSGLAETLGRMRPEARMRVAEGLAALPDPTALRAVVEEAADVLAESIHALAQVVPADLRLHGLPDADASFARPHEPRTVDLRQIARRTFDVLRMERIRTSSLPLVHRITDLVAEAGGIPDVVAFGLDSAERELSGGEDGVGDRARTLAREALERAADALVDLPGRVTQAVWETRAAVEAETARGWSRLVERGLAEGVESQLLDARSSVRLTFGELRGRWGPPLRSAWRRIGSEWARLRHVASGLVRRGRRMVGAPGGAQVSYRAGKVLAEIGTLYGSLPLVYQRLYSLNPVSDPALLVGRDSILSEIERRFEAWRDDDGIPLVVYARPGVGISSLFQVLMGRLNAGDGRAVHHTLHRRYRDEAGFACHLSAVLGLPPVSSMDELTSTVLGAKRGDVPDLVALEEMEHLYLRAPGGTDLVERLLTLMSETEPRIFWLGSTTQSAWQLVRKAEPSAVSQVEHVELPALDAEQIRLAILARHRRSGVPHGYEEPVEGRHLLRRRLRRIKGPEGRRLVLERDFFAKLHHASGGNIGLAIYHWLRAADFTSVPGEVRVRPVESVDFSFLDGLDLAQNFTLKALLEHRTLTLEEHDAIFRIPRQESFQIMESLQNRYLVEPVRGSGGPAAHAGAGEDERRYRILPLLAAAVASHLAARNIVH